MGLRRTPAAIAALGAAAALVIAGCSSTSSPSASSTSSSSAPTSLTVWRMGGSVPSQVTWMNNVVARFHEQHPAYAHTKVNVVWVPWTSRTTDWNDALTSGKNAPDITEPGNTDTPAEASLGMLANITTSVNSWNNKPDLVLVEMGLPLWHPPEGTSYLATYGASRASAHAAAEWLGLA